MQFWWEESNWWLYFMKASEKNTLQEEPESVIAKPFPGKPVQGQSMVKKFEDAKVLSSSIKGFKEKKQP